MFVGRYGKKPMQFFGLMGSIFFLLGFGISIFLLFSKMVNAEYSITNKPGFYIALISMVIGVQLFLAGFLAELIVRNAPERNQYGIEEKLGL
jgi:TRAP-type mannitol/chloroaromatic compound transport system permease small subunit